MNSGDYWKRRAQMVMEQGMESADKVVADLRAGYRRAQREVQAGIDMLYANFAKDGLMTYADAVEYLSSDEVKEWRFTLAEYVERINATGDEELLRELNALSARSRIRRLQQVETAIRVAASELAGKGEALVRDLLTDAYRGTYRAIGNDIASALGLSGRLEMLNARTVAQAIAYPWSGASYSERIWHNAEQLSAALRQTVTQGLIQGQDIRQMAGSIRKATATAAQHAERLVRTEVARCVEDAALEGYRATGIDQYQILVDADDRTCGLCGGIDEEEPHDVADAVVGVNVPPFHPNCRCTTVPYFSAERLARWERLGAAEIVENAAERDIMGGKSEEDVIPLNVVAHIDREKYAGVAANIRSDRVVLMDKPRQHIIDRRGQAFFDRYEPYFKEIAEDPDYIFADPKHENTAIACRTLYVDGKHVNLVIRLSVEGDQEGLENSIITAIIENDRRYAQRLRNNTPLYRKE